LAHKSGQNVGAALLGVVQSDAPDAIRMRTFSQSNQPGHIHWAITHVVARCQNSAWQIARIVI